MTSQWECCLQKVEAQQLSWTCRTEIKSSHPFSKPLILLSGLDHISSSLLSWLQHSINFNLYNSTWMHHSCIVHFSKRISFGLGRPPKEILCMFSVSRPHSLWQQLSHVTLWVVVSHGLPCYYVPSALTSFLPDAEWFQTNISFSHGKWRSLWKQCCVSSVIVCPTLNCNQMMKDSVSFFL